MIIPTAIDIGLMIATILSQNVAGFICKIKLCLY